jgi:dolichol kinase
MRAEIERQIFHLVLGIAALVILLILGRPFVIAGSFIALIVGFFLVNRMLLKKKAPVADLFVKRFERKGAIFPGWGSANYGLGVLLVAALLDSTAYVAAALIVLALGDGFSTLLGKLGKHKLQWNERKTWEGTVAFLVGCLPGYFFVGPLILPLALIGAFIESIDWPLDDNLMIPLACILFFWVI